MYLPYGRSVWTVMLLFGRCLDERSFYFCSCSGYCDCAFILAWRGGRTYCNTICPVGTVLGFLSRYSYLNRLLIRLNVMVADFVLVIASLPALIPKHMRLIIPVVLLVWIV